MNVYLIGYRGTGKSTVGRMLAQRLGLPFVDSDDEIERQAGRAIADIFASQGEPAFRDMEQSAIEQIGKGEPCVASLGGGAVLREANREVIGRGAVLCLWADSRTLAARLAADAATAGRRPSLTNLPAAEEIEHVLGEREPLYRQCADYIVPTDGRSPAEVAEAALALLGDRLHPSRETS